MNFPVITSKIKSDDEIVALGAGKQKLASIYLNSIANLNSRRTMKTGLVHFTKSYFPELLSLNDAPWLQLSAEIIEHYRNSMMDDDYTFTTINNYMAAIRGLTKAIWRRKLMDTDTYMRIISTDGVKGTRLPKGRLVPKNEQLKLMSVCKNDKNAAGLRDACIIGLALNCGLRRSEIINIDYENIDFSAKEIRIIGKGNKERLTPLNKTLLSIIVLFIEELRGTSPGPLLTRIRKGGDVTSERLTDQSVYYIFSIRCVEASISAVAPHDCRRTVATTLLDKGAALSDVQMFLGHADSKTTQRYDMKQHRQQHQTAQLLEDD